MVNSSSENSNCLKKFDTLAEKVLNIARWAPSGDNSQCWRFELINENTFIIHAHDTREEVVYDFDGHSSHLAHGILLETINIAASYFSCRVNLNSDIRDDTLLKFKIELIKDSDVKLDPLFHSIKTRSVQRRCMSSQALSKLEKLALNQSLPKGFSVNWFDSKPEKRKFAWLSFLNAKTRLTMREAFEVHKNIIDWGQQFSETKIPEQALGVDWFTARLMQWLFKSWNRVKFFNKFLAGTILPRIQLEFLPGIKCGSHFTIESDHNVTDINHYLEAGRAIQRFWLTADSLKIGLQPSYTPLIFSRYLNFGLKFTKDKKVMEHAIKSNQIYTKLVKFPERVTFMGRVGKSQYPKSRSIRLELGKLMIK